jgi:hypothetical protein
VRSVSRTWIAYETCRSHHWRASVMHGGAKLEGIVGSEFVHMDYGEAMQALERTNEEFEFPVNWGVDLQSEHERYLTEKHTKRPFFAMNYPKDIKAFYMRVNENGRTVAAMDVLAPGIGEIIGGSQRGAARRTGPRHGRAPRRPRALRPHPSLPRERGRVREGICAATARCRTLASASARLSPGAPSPTSPASPTSATRSPSRAPPATRGIDSHYSRP